MTRAARVLGELPADLIAYVADSRAGAGESVDLSFFGVHVRRACGDPDRTVHGAPRRSPQHRGMCRRDVGRWAGGRGAAWAGVRYGKIKEVSHVCGNSS